jgi:uncharacterized cupin superfamily protein
VPKLDIDTIPQTNATGYPAVYADEVKGRFYRRLAPPSGLTEFGASHVVLKPGAWSSQRHWHEDEDEMVIMLSGEAVLVEDDGRHIMRCGDVAVFPKGAANGHVLINESNSDCVFIAIGRPSASDCHYPDIDMHLFNGTGFRKKDGSEF